MKECRICKSQNDDSVLFCHVCGTKFASQSQGTPQEAFPQSLSTSSVEEEQANVESLKQYEYLVLDSLNNEIRSRHAFELDQSGPNYSFVFRQLATGFLCMLGKDGWKLITTDPSFGHNLIFMREVN